MTKETIQQVRQYITSLRTKPELLNVPKPIKIDNNEPHKPSLDFQLLERRQTQLMRKYKRPPGYSDAKEANVLNELEEQSKTRFLKNWKDLPKGLQKNRITHYVNKLKRKQHWSKKDAEKADNLLKYKLSIMKPSDIMYDEIKGEIHKIPSLTFHYTSDGLHFKWKNMQKK